MTLEELLVQIEAPEALIRRVREQAWTLDDAWARSMPATHRMWLAACVGAPIEVLVEAAASAVWATSERFADVPPSLGDTVALAIEGAEPSALLAAATACEELAATSGSYRTTRPPGFDALARAAALVAHAAEGLASAAARREAVRLEQARHTGALIGAGASVALPSADGPLRLDVRAAASDPAQGALLFASAACAESVRECADALTAAGDAATLLDPVVLEVLSDRPPG